MSYVGWYVYTVDCAFAPVPLFLVLGVVPVTCLVLMYMAFISQKWQEHGPGSRSERHAYRIGKLGGAVKESSHAPRT